MTAHVDLYKFAALFAARSRARTDEGILGWLRPRRGAAWHDLTTVFSDASPSPPPDLPFSLLQSHMRLQRMLVHRTQNW